MTDVVSTSGPDAPTPLPVDGPQAVPVSPIPLGVPVRRRSALPVIVIIGVVVALIGACVGVSYLASTTLQDALSPSSEPSLVPSFAYGGFTMVGWSGGGRYAVIQHFDEGNVPAVTVWDRETQTTRVQGGYVVVGLESEGAQVWMEPAETVADAFDSFGDPIDHRPERLVAWRLDTGTQPSDAASAKWRAWPGPGDYTAYLELDPLKGCMPSRLLMNNNAGSGEGVRAALPETTRTFAPVGWSPSGAYFAIEELVDGVDAGLLGDSLGFNQPQQPERDLLVFSAATGELVARAVLPKGATRAPLALWGADDTLYWADMDAAQSSDQGWGAPDLRTLRPDGDAGVVRIPDAISLDRAYTFLPLGSDAEGALFYADDGKLWRIGLTGLEHVGNVSYSESADWDPRGGLLVARTQYDYVDESTETNYALVLLVDGHGANEREIWRGPAVRLDTAPLY